MNATEADLNDILVFAKVVEHGSFTAAGRHLFLPKSSVSRKVSRLEERLGVRLLQRTTRSLTLTPAGQTYFERVSRMVADLEDVEATLRGYAQVPKGPLRITVPVSLMDTAPGLFPGFLLKYPEVKIYLEATDRVVNVVEEGFDLAIRGGRPPDASLQGHQILGTGYQLLASPSYLEKAGRPERAADLREHACLILGPKNRETWEFTSSRGEVTVAVSGPFASTNMRALLEAAQAGLGIARLPLSGIAGALEGLELVMPELESPGGGLWVVYPSEQHLSPAVRAFLEFLDTFGLDSGSE